MNGRDRTRTCTGVTLDGLARRCVPITPLFQGGVGRTRTYEARRPLIYNQAELPLSDYPKVSLNGIEPLPSVLSGQRSPDELQGHRRWEQESNPLRRYPRLFSGEFAPVGHPTTLSIALRARRWHE